MGLEKGVGHIPRSRRTKGRGKSRKVFTGTEPVTKASFGPPLPSSPGPPPPAPHREQCFSQENTKRCDSRPAGTLPRSLGWAPKEGEPAPLVRARGRPPHASQMSPQNGENQEVFLIMRETTLPLLLSQLTKAPQSRTF